MLGLAVYLVASSFYLLTALYRWFTSGLQTRKEKKKHLPDGFLGAIKRLGKVYMHDIRRFCGSTAEEGKDNLRLMTRSFTSLRERLSVEIVEGLFPTVILGLEFK